MISLFIQLGEWEGEWSLCILILILIWSSRSGEGDRVSNGIREGGLIGACSLNIELLFGLLGAGGGISGEGILSLYEELGNLITYFRLVTTRGIWIVGLSSNSGMSLCIGVWSINASFVLFLPVSLPSKFLSFSFPNPSL